MSIHSADAVINDYVDPSLGEIDPVKEYLKQAGETGLLSSEEEHALALRIQNGDFDAKNELICANLRRIATTHPSDSGFRLMLHGGFGNRSPEGSRIRTA